MNRSLSIVSPAFLGNNNANMVKIIVSQLLSLIRKYPCYGWVLINAVCFPIFQVFMFGRIIVQDYNLLLLRIILVILLSSISISGMQSLFLRLLGTTRFAITWFLVTLCGVSFVYYNFPPITSPISLIAYPLAGFRLYTDSALHGIFLALIFGLTYGLIDGAVLGFFQYQAIKRNGIKKNWILKVMLAMVCSSVLNSLIFTIAGFVLNSRLPSWVITLALLNTGIFYGFFTKEFISKIRISP